MISLNPGSYAIQTDTYVTLVQSISPLFIHVEEGHLVPLLLRIPLPVVSPHQVLLGEEGGEERKGGGGDEVDDRLKEATPCSKYVIILEMYRICNQ